MRNSNSLIPKKEGILLKIINKIKRIFYSNCPKKEDNLQEKIESNDNKKDFLSNIKITIDTEIYSLKLKLESGEVKAIELTDEQIEKLQKVYDEEILQKRRRLNELKQSA